ncbi:9483_t:CDS:2, partial [Paraglomus occultum]
KLAKQSDYTPCEKNDLISRTKVSAIFRELQKINAVKRIHLELANGMTQQEQQQKFIHLQKNVFE